MFIDRAIITVGSGKGGDGVVSFRREKYVPRGGPDGGDGGRGGSVYLRANAQLNTLEPFKYQPRYLAANGVAGAKQKRTGASGADLIVECPVGTLIFRLPEDELLADLDEDGKSFLVAQGGRGGKGNHNFATPTRRAPRIATPGTSGELFKLRLELKLLADVGLAGMPNAGKSSLISLLSNARPEVGDYPFTTLTPHLGVVSVDRERHFVMADVPGLIEGAAQGAGLGHDFLRHLERSALIAVVVDVAGVEGRDPLDDYRAVRKELAEYDAELDGRVGLVIANKADLPAAEDGHKRLLGDVDLPVALVSAATGLGRDELVGLLAGLLSRRGLWSPQVEEPQSPHDPLA